MPPGGDFALFLSGGIAAITDAVSGVQITMQNPIQPGQIVAFRGTGLHNLKFNPKDSLLEQTPIELIGQSLSGTIILHPSWAGESPVFPGLDQVNVVFQSCTTSTTPGIG